MSTRLGSFVPASASASFTPQFTFEARSSFSASFCAFATLFRRPVSFTARLVGWAWLPVPYHLTSLVARALAWPPTAPIQFKRIYRCALSSFVCLSKASPAHSAPATKCIFAVSLFDSALSSWTLPPLALRKLHYVSRSVKQFSSNPPIAVYLYFLQFAVAAVWFSCLVLAVSTDPLSVWVWSGELPVRTQPSSWSPIPFLAAASGALVPTPRTSAPNTPALLAYLYIVQGFISLSSRLEVLTSQGSASIASVSLVIYVRLPTPTRSCLVALLAARTATARHVVPSDATQTPVSKCLVRCGSS